MVYGVEAGTLEGVVRGAELSQPGLELCPGGATLIVQPEPSCRGRAASAQLRSSGNRGHDRAEEVTAPPPLWCQQLSSNLGRRLWFADF